jgi:hypothetical protein
MPAPHRLVPEVVRTLLDRWFGPDRTLAPSTDLSRGIVARCSTAGIDGGAVYDALVGLTANEAHCRLLTRDERAARTYRRLGIDVEIMT